MCCVTYSHNHYVYYLVRRFPSLFKYQKRKNGQPTPLTEPGKTIIFITSPLLFNSMRWRNKTRLRDVPIYLRYLHAVQSMGGNGCVISLRNFRRRALLGVAAKTLLILDVFVDSIQILLPLLSRTAVRSANKRVGF